MKKLIAVLAAAVIAGGALFAGDFYNGDIQLQVGAGFDTTKLQYVNDPITATVFDFGVDSWHLFKPLDMLGVGFSVGFNGGAGKTDRWNNGYGSLVKPQDGTTANLNFNIGPAAAVYLGKVVRFGVNFGYNVGLTSDEPVVFEYDIGYTHGTSRTTIWSTYSGIDFGIQAKFVPYSKVSPVVGWRLVKGSSSSYDYSSSGITGYSEYTTGTNYDKYEFTQNLLYAGVTFNW